MGACIPNISPLIQAGINPKTGLPYKFNLEGSSKEDIKRFLRLIDEQDAVNRYVWYNLPCNLTSQELERLLYYKGQLAFFYYKELDEFYFMPYALDGSIDFYQRFNSIHPVPMSTGTDEEKKDSYKIQAETLSAIKKKCYYGLFYSDKDEDLINAYLDGCVLLHDYSKQLSQTILPRQIVNDPIIDAMSECVPYMQTSLLLATGIKGVRVPDADSEESVVDGSISMKDSALKQKPWIPLTSAIEFQELTNGQVAQAQEFMLAMQSLDNLRLSGYGIDNGGLFEKKAHELQSEADINGGPVGLVLQDGLSIRQNFCNIVNSIWGLGIWCEPAQNIMGMDNDGDGAIYEDNMDGSNTGVEVASDEGGSDNE